MTDFGYREPSIDHSLISPSGRMSKRAFDAALERERVKLFGEDGLAWPKAEQPTKADVLLRQADELESLAKRGMKPRAYKRKATQLRAEAEKLTGADPAP